MYSERRLIPLVRDIVGPLELEGRWGMFRVEQFLPASLEDSQLKQALQNELFERWLTAKIQTMVVKLQWLNLAFDASKSLRCGTNRPNAF